jgi:hypothetical protein
MVSAQLRGLAGIDFAQLAVVRFSPPHYGCRTRRKFALRTGKFAV